MVDAMKAMSCSILIALLSAQVSGADDTERWPPSHEIPVEDGRRALDEMRTAWQERDGWQLRAANIRAHVRQTLDLDELPPPCPLDPVMHDRHLHDGYSVESVHFESFPGFFISGNLYRPADIEGPHPIVLCPHGHARADGTRPEGRFRADYQRLCATLARMGALVLTWDMVGWGENEQVPHRRPESTVLQTYNTMRAIDFMQSLEDADGDRIGITGSSGGGTQTFLATMLDERIDVSVPVVMVSAHFFGGCSCESGLPIHDGPGFRTNNVEFAACAAPRPTLLLSVGGDWTTNTPEIEFPYLQEVYRTMGVPDACANVHLPEEEHDYGSGKRFPAYRFLARHLGLDLASVTNPDGSIDEAPVHLHPRHELLAFNDGHPRPPRAQMGAEAVDSAWARHKRRRSTQGNDTRDEVRPEDS